MIEALSGSFTETHFWANVHKTDNCWIWTGWITRWGYGSFRPYRGRHWRAHRVAYELLVGPIPTDRILDHTCHKANECPGGDTCPHRRCVNPAHLEVVTHGENTRRGHNWQTWKTHCPQGHEYSAENTYFNPKSGRTCRICKTARDNNRPRNGKRKVNEQRVY